LRGVVNRAIRKRSACAQYATTGTCSVPFNSGSRGRETGHRAAVAKGL
jgi:hypothetical protein